MVPKTKGRRGYTKWGYPIVWLRSNSHEECMKKLKEKDLNFTKKVISKQKKISGFNFQVSGDDNCITLKIENSKTYYSTLAELAEGFKRILVRKKIKNAGVMTDLNKLIYIERETAKEIRALFAEGDV